MRAKRKTQEQRSAETQARLLDATIELLDEIGFSRLTTPDVARHAEVSRGALTHQFASKEDLIVSAVQKLLTTSTQEIRSFAKAVQSGDMTIESFIDELWKMFSGRLFMVTLEFIPEARHNENFRTPLIPVVRDFHAALNEIWRSFFDSDDHNIQTIEAELNATLCFLRGLGLQTVLVQDPTYFPRMLSFWKSRMRTMIAPKRAVERETGR